MGPKVDLEAIERRSRDATPGPWLPDTSTLDSSMLITVRTGQRTRPLLREDKYATPADVVFCCCARDDVPALIARVRELEAEVNRWSGLGRYVRGGIDDETCETMARILLGDTRACDPEIVESADRLIDLYARKV